MKNLFIRDELLSWYRANKRELPWRNNRDPYRIWLSEVILQQTRVEQGLPYFQRITDQYPTVNDLANASEEEVLRSWQGLGYYSRARNMHKCAKIVVSDYNSEFPDSKAELLKLPGIGPYTAAAIASIAFGEAAAVVDGNVIRVITRLFGVADDISTPSTQKKIQAIADELISQEHPDLFNQAIMEFGALHCTPNQPDCVTCPFSQHCKSLKAGTNGKIPFKKKKIKKRNRYFHYLLINRDGKYLMKQRSNKDIWQGLFEFFLLESDSGRRISMVSSYLRYWLINLINGSWLENRNSTNTYLAIKTYFAAFLRSM